MLWNIRIYILYTLWEFFCCFFFFPVGTEVAYLLFIWVIRYFTTIQCLLSGEWAKASGGRGVKERKYVCFCTVRVVLLLLVLILFFSSPLWKYDVCFAYRLNCIHLNRGGACSISAVSFIIYLSTVMVELDLGEITLDKVLSHCLNF